MKRLYFVEIGKGLSLTDNSYYVVAANINDAMTKIKTYEKKYWENENVVFRKIELKAHDNGSLIL